MSLQIINTISILVQCALVITKSLGPVKLLCYIEILLYPEEKNNKIQRNFESLGPKELLCYISVLHNESPLYLEVITVMGYWKMGAVILNFYRITLFLKEDTLLLNHLNQVSRQLDIQFRSRAKNKSRSMQTLT